MSMFCAELMYKYFAGIMMIGVPTSLVTIGKDLDHLKEAKNVDTITVQAGMIIGEQMTDISLVDRDQGKLPPR